MRTREKTPTSYSARAGTFGATLCIALSALGVLGGCGSSPEAPTPEPPAAVQPSNTPQVKPVAAGRAPAQVGRPTRVVIADLGLNEPLSAVGLKPDGAMETPDFGAVGWYDLGPRPGARGPAVIVAHVHGPAGDDVFANLSDLEPGDRIRVRRTDGATTFVVDSVQQTAKERLPVKRIWTTTDQALLRLITCAGTPDPVSRMYPDNTVVYAHAVR